MKNSVLFLTFIALSVSSFKALAFEQTDASVFVDMQSFSHSEPISIYGLFNDWEGTYSSGRKSFSINKIEVGFSLNEWQLSVLNRQDYLFEFAPDTAKLFYDTKNTKSLEAGEIYNLDLTSQSFLARGLKLAYTKQFKQFKVGISAAYLEGYDLLDGKLSGKAEATAENDYDFNFAVDYAYSEDALFSRKGLDDVKGQGYAFDLDLAWQINQDWRVSAQIVDMFARIYWFDAPRTIATGSSQTKDYDEDGFVVFRPVASGLETNDSFTQYIQTKVFAQTHYVLNEQHELLFEVDDYGIKRFYSGGYQHHLNANSHVQAKYNFTAKAVELSYQNNWLRASLLSDALHFEKANTLGLLLSARYQF